MPNALEKIKHIVVLMLENRSLIICSDFCRVISMARRPCREIETIPEDPTVNPPVPVCVADTAHYSTISILIQDMMCTMSTSNYSTSPKGRSPLRP